MYENHFKGKPIATVLYDCLHDCLYENASCRSQEVSLGVLVVHKAGKLLLKECQRILFKTHTETHSPILTNTNTRTQREIAQYFAICALQHDHLLQPLNFVSINLLLVSTIVRFMFSVYWCDYENINFLSFYIEIYKQIEIMIYISN